MRLHLYREHMARELDQLPDPREQTIQSYVITTAILARRIDDRLGGRIQTELVEPYFGRPLNFRELLNMLLHYVRFSPDFTVNNSAQIPLNPDAMFYVRAYSEDIKKKHNAGEWLSVRLADYFSIIKSIVNDDILVYQHLVAATFQRLRRVIQCNKEKNRDELEEIVASFDDVIWLSRRLIDSTGLKLSDIPLKVYDVRYERVGLGDWDIESCLEVTNRYVTFGDFVQRYDEWNYAPFSPSQVKGWGYCVYIEIPTPKFIPMALPFKKIKDTLLEIKSDCNSCIIATRPFTLSWTIVLGVGVVNPIQDYQLSSGFNMRHQLLKLGR